MPLYEARSKEHPEVVIQFEPMTWVAFQEFLKENPAYEPIMSVPAYVKVN